MEETNSQDTGVQESSPAPEATMSTEEMTQGLATLSADDLAAFGQELAGQPISSESENTTEEPDKKGQLKMNRQVEQEIDRTLDWLGKQEDIQVSPLFIETLCSKVGHLRTHRSVGHRNRYSYLVAISLMAALNIAVLIATLCVGQPVGGETYDSTDVIAREYGIGQSTQIAF